MLVCTSKMSLRSTNGVSKSMKKQKHIMIHKIEDTYFTTDPLNIVKMGKDLDHLIFEYVGRGYYRDDLNKWLYEGTAIFTFEPTDKEIAIVLGYSVQHIPDDKLDLSELYDCNTSETCGFILNVACGAPLNVSDNRFGHHVTQKEWNYSKAADTFINECYTTYRWQTPLMRLAI
jgi:hypothetical protein